MIVNHNGETFTAQATGVHLCVFRNSLRIIFENFLKIGNQRKFSTRINSLEDFVRKSKNKYIHEI
jgi:hypothetical protein